MNIVKNFPLLLPSDADMSKWAVIACDQYTTDEKYWETLSDYIGDAPSTLNLILPEIYLKEKDVEKRIQKINETMNIYCESGLFHEVGGYVLTERTLSDGRKRLGLVASVDLDEYDYLRDDVKIRSTEQTIEERLPFRIHIRENAPIELPHILLLLDDSERNIILPLYKQRVKFKKLYDFDLNMDGGHIRGYEIPERFLGQEKFDALLSPALQEKKYGKNAGLLFAIGDGNHSMATAKKCWEAIKPSLSEKERQNHPARYVLVEIVNVYDEALDFLPIHRNVFCSSPDDFVFGLKEALGGGNGTLKIITKSGETLLPCPENAAKTIVSVQKYLEKYAQKEKIRIEYVHESKKVIEDGQKDGGVGILMPSFPKEDLFPYVIRKGKLPKKAFSIGEEKTKKYYIEAKRIK